MLPLGGIRRQSLEPGKDILKVVGVSDTGGASGNFYLRWRKLLNQGLVLLSLMRLVDRHLGRDQVLHDSIGSGARPEM